MLGTHIQLIVAEQATVQKLKSLSLSPSLSLIFRDRVSLCGHGSPISCSVDKAGLELRDLPASASRVLLCVLKVTVTKVNGLPGHCACLLSLLLSYPRKDRCVHAK